MPLTPAIAQELLRILGADGLVTTPEGRMVYEADMHTFYKGAPDAVALPRTTAQVQAVVKLCRRESLAVVPRGSGTGLIGGAMAPKGGVMVSVNRMDGVLEVDLPNHCAVVQPGLINLWLTKAIGDRGYFFAPDPSSQMVSSIGGNVATNAGGPHCLKYGITTNHVLGLEIVTGTGEVVSVGGKAADRPGYDLTGTMVGNEGTFGLVTAITVRLLHLPEAVKTALASFASLVEASEAVSAIIAAGIIPAALEMLDDAMIGAVNLHPLICYDDRKPGELERAQQANEELLHACIALGGSVSGEHGIGMDKAKNLPLQYAEADLNFMFRLRRVFDPDGLMNPAKLLPSHPACGEGFRPSRPTLPAGTWV